MILLQCLAQLWLYNSQYTTQHKAAIVLQTWAQVILVQQHTVRAAEAAERERRKAAECELDSRRSATAGNKVAAVVRIQSCAQTFVYRN